VTQVHSDNIKVEEHLSCEILKQLKENNLIFKKQEESNKILNKDNIREDLPLSDHHFETLEEVREILGRENPNMTKDELYEEMLKSFSHQKIIEMDTRTRKERVAYVCMHNRCNKKYFKAWNFLDHVRMHKGIRPFKCEHCPKSFTQKGNLKKHQIQHSIATLKERKRFKCNICNKSYTERYNLEVSWLRSSPWQTIYSHGNIGAYGYTFVGCTSWWLR